MKRQSLQTTQHPRTVNGLLTVHPNLSKQIACAAPEKQLLPPVVLVHVRRQWEVNQRNSVMLGA